MKHSGRYAEIAHALTENGILVFAHDYVGHGLTAAADKNSRSVIATCNRTWLMVCVYFSDLGDFADISQGIWICVIT